LSLYYSDMEAEHFNWGTFLSGLNRAGLKIGQNYLNNLSGYQHDGRDIFLTYANFFTKIAVNPVEMVKIRDLYISLLFNRQKAFDDSINVSAGTKLPEIEKNEKRFLDEEWKRYPYFNFLRENYLLVEKFAQQVIEEVELDDKKKKKLEFFTKQYLDLLSPSNFLFTNPEAMKIAVKTKGKSLWDGFNNLIGDIEKGRITQCDKNAFEVGRDLATTAGQVVFQNEIMQLIQYIASTKNVREIPLLMVPPWINKYYIFDLQAKKSFVKYLVEQGISVYVISWKNPMPGEGNLSFGDYVKQGAMKAVEVIQEISSTKKVNALGYCLGGTLLSIATSIFASDKKESPINSATFLASMIDFSDIGPMGDVIDAALVKKLERGELLNNGVMRGEDMERAFDLIRANDLIWYYVVNNYLKGSSPAPYDVLYWTNDNTNLPENMYKFYMRNMILENRLSRKNALRICNERIDVGKIDCPVFVIAFTEDYISPARTVFTITELVSGDVEFILGGSGHVVGAINHPSKNKYGYLVNGKLEHGFDEWKNTAEHKEGSWWTYWTKKLIENSGKQVPAPLQAGNKKYKVIEPAPGTYVKRMARSQFVEN
jgi:polyhydroxyalkanoate synthase